MLWPPLATHLGPHPAGVPRPTIDRTATRVSAPPGLPTLRQLLIRLLLLGQLPVLAMTGLWLAAYRSHEEARGTEILLARAHALALALGENAQAMERQLEGLAAQAPADDSGLEAYYRLAEQVARTAGVQGIVFTMASGEKMILAPTPVPAPERPAHPAAGASPPAQPADAGAGRQELAGTVGAVVPGPSFFRALSARLDAAGTQGLLERLALPATWSAAVIEARGTVVAASGGAIHPGFLDDARVLERAREYEGGVVRPTTSAGMPMLTAYVRSPVPGWSVVVSMPRKELYSRWWSFAWLWLLLPLPTAALSLRLCARALASVDRPRPEAAGAGHADAAAPLHHAFAEASLVDARLPMPGAQARRASARPACSDELLEAILQAGTDAIVVIDARHRVVLANQAAARAFGRSVQELAGADLGLLLTPGTFARYLAGRKAREAGFKVAEPQQLPMPWFRRAGGSSFPIQATLSVFSDEMGRRFCTLVLRDIRMKHGHAGLQSTNTDARGALAREAESREAAMGRELHDGVASSLAGVSLLLARARSSAPHAEAAALIRAAHEQVVKTMQQVRRLSRGIMPAGHDDGAVVPALELFAADIDRLPDVRCSMTCRGDFEDLSGEVGGHLVRIAQEATNNALRHGAAHRIRITLARVGEQCRLTVTDDGKGCDPRVLAGPATGIGIRSMRARADAIGGVFMATAWPGRGCRVRVTWFAARPGSTYKS